jgi:hypothetical protein
LHGGVQLFGCQWALIRAICIEKSQHNRLASEL